MFKLNFGFEENSNESDDEDDFKWGFNSNFDGEEEDKNRMIRFNKSNEVKENIPTN